MLFMFYLIVSIYTTSVTTLQPIMSTVYLVRNYSYPVEVHEIVTEDGYILGAHRIPYGLKNNSTGNRIPVIMYHGLMGSSDNFVILGADKAIAFMLADEGYDVWMANARGNSHSRRHLNLNPDTDKTFWDFSWHEIGVIDLPNNIDYILNKTGHNKLHYIGHSQGTTVFWAMLAKRPEYNEKIISMSAFAPSAFLGHIRNPLAVGFSRIHEFLEILAERLGIYELVFPRSNVFLSELLKTVCSISPTVEKICAYLAFFGNGYDLEQLDISNFHNFADMIAGASTKQAIHYAQIVNSGLFREYDYRQHNFERYGTNKPPSYNLKNVKAPVGLFHASNDHFCVPEDVEHLAKRLPNVGLKYLVPYKKFNHFDFVIARDARKLVYERTLQFMKSSET